jgi:histone deacetylase complex regulatory component SIN3
MSNYINGITNYIERGQFKRLDETQLFVQYGSDLDNISYKFKAYNNGHLNNRINESISVAFTPAESVAITNVFLNFLEEYKQTLLNEQNIYEQYLNILKN